MLRQQFCNLLDRVRKPSEMSLYQRNFSKHYSRAEGGGSVSILVTYDAESVEVSQAGVIASHSGGLRFDSRLSSISFLSTLKFFM
jgi:hypothetical protein